MAQGTRYSDDFKAEVLAMYEVDGPAAAGHLYGVPRPTVNGWARRYGFVYVSGSKNATAAACNATKTLRERVRGKLLACVDLILDDIEANALARDRKDNAMAAAILLDKFRLEVGEVTGREEVRHDYSERPDSELIREAESILQEAADEGPA